MLFLFTVYITRFADRGNRCDCGLNGGITIGITRGIIPDSSEARAAKKAACYVGREAEALEARVENTRRRTTAN